MLFFSNEDFKKIIGLEFDDEIEQALEQSLHFLLVCTPDAMASEWVRDEYKEEDQKEGQIQKKSDENLFKKFLIIIRKKKFIKWYTIGCNMILS